MSAGFGQAANFPQDAGVTPNQEAWLFYSWRYGGTKIVWVDVTGKLLGISWTSLRQRSRVVAIDNTNTAFVCGVEDTQEADLPPITKCFALAAGNDEPLWELTLDDQVGSDVVGAAMNSGNLYVVTDAGVFFAIEQIPGETQNSEAAVPTVQPES